MKTNTTRAMYDNATGDLMIADVGFTFPNRFIHFDSEFEAQQWCEKRGFEFHAAGFGSVPFPKHLSDKMRKIQGE